MMVPPIRSVSAAYASLECNTSLVLEYILSANAVDAIFTPSWAISISSFGACTIRVRIIRVGALASVTIGGSGALNRIGARGGRVMSIRMLHGVTGVGRGRER